MTKEICDEANRQTIKTNLNVNILVEAGAGSGKTTCLIARMIELIRSGICISEMVAITFTRKAANELRERFQSELRKTKPNNPLEEKRFEEALRNMNRCFLGTVHSFCSQLLRERPVEGKVDPHFEELDDRKDKLLQKQAWDSFLANPPESQLQHLRRIGISPIDIFGGYQKVIEFSDVDEWVSHRIRKPVFTEALLKLKVLISHALPSFSKDHKENEDKLQIMILQAYRQLKHVDLSNDIQIKDIIAPFVDKKIEVTQYKWDPKSEGKYNKEKFTNFAEQYAKPVIQAWREYCHYDVLQFVLSAKKYYESRKSQLSQLNFQDLLVYTRNMLKKHPEVRAYFQQKYKVIMVDEFQDTDPIQAEIMFYLTGEEVAGSTEWHELVPKPGSLFIVGDPKQSIYRFRRADIDTYNRVKGLIAKHKHGKVLELNSNFRSLPSVVNGINSVFKDIKKDSYQVDFKPMVPSRSENEEELQSGILVYGDKNVTFEEEAELIAKYIQGAIRGGTQATDFMILSRKKKHMEVYARKLKEYGIPVEVSGGAFLNQSFHIREMFNLLKVLAVPDHQVYLVTVLRGLFFGISDHALYMFKQAGGNLEFCAPIPDGLEDDVDAVFRPAFELLKKYHQWTQDFSPVVAMEKIIIDLGLIAFTAAEEYEKDHTREIYQMLEILRQAELEGATNFDSLVNQYENVMELDMLLENYAFQVRQKNAVQIMTVHKAKGLEARIIFLINPKQKNTERPIFQHISRQDDKSRGYVVFTKKLGYSSETPLAQPLNWDNYAEEEKCHLQAEEVRLAYVAASRAGNTLVISDCGSSGGNPWKNLLSKKEQIKSLEIPDLPGDFKSKEPESIRVEDRENGNPESFDEVKKDLDQWQELLKIPSYDTLSPSDQINRETLTTIERLDGGGKHWGKMIHRVLELLVKEGYDDYPLVIEGVLNERGYKNFRDEKEAIEKLIGRFCRSEIGYRISKAFDKYTEVPFDLRLYPDDLLYPKNREQSIPIRYTGTIDLVLRESDGWSIIDYKTDRIKDASKLPILAREYGEQVKSYAKVWEKITGQMIQRVELYFTEEDQVIRVD